MYIGSFICVLIGVFSLPRLFFMSAAAIDKADGFRAWLLYR